MDIRGLLTLLLLASLAALSSWMLSFITPQPPPKKAQHIPDYHIESFVAREFDTQGNLYHYLFAKTMNHYPDDDSTDLEEPLAMFFEQGKELWRLQSTQGHVSSDGKKIILFGDVFIRRDSRPNWPKLTLSTQHLTVYPEKRFADTKEPVVITHGNDRMTATGLSATLQQRGQLQLLSKVRGTYAPR